MRLTSPFDTFHATGGGYSARADGEMARGDDLDCQMIRLDAEVLSSKTVDAISSPFILQVVVQQVVHLEARN